MEERGELHAPTPLTPRDRVAGMHWIRDWAGPIDGLDIVNK
jgi:hypothetical protein